MDTQDNNREQEIFKDIPGYEGFYQVGNQGRVKSLSRKYSPVEIILSPGRDKDGYPRVVLYRDKKSLSIKVHQLVMLTFVGECPKGLQINHIDGNKENNHLDNLEYCTPAENVQHAHDTGLRVSPYGEDNGRSKLTESQVLEIRGRYKASGVSQRKLAQEYGVNHATIGFIVRRETWNHI